MEVYHGSLTDITDEYLKPNQAFNNDLYKPWVYLSSSYVNALLYSVNPIRSYLLKNGYLYDARSFSAHIDFKQTPPIVYEIYDGMFEELFNTRSFIYVCDIDDCNVEGNNKEIKIENIVKIKKKIEIANFYEELLSMEKNDEVVLKRFNSWDTYQYNIFISDYISTKASSIETYGEIQFYQDKFPNNLEIQKIVTKALEKIEL